jgi:hypothetical protein
VSPGADAKLLKDVTDVNLCGRFGNEERGCYFAITLSLREKSVHFFLAVRKGGAALADSWCAAKSYAGPAREIAVIRSGKN